MALPGFEAYIQPLPAHVNAIAIVDRIRQAIAKPPCVVPEIAPRQVDSALSWLVGQIDDDDRPLLTLFPTPGHETLEARIIGPAGATAQAPGAFVKQRIIDSFQELFVEAFYVLVWAFFRPAAQKDRRPDAASLKLSFVEEPCARKRSRRER